METNFVKKPLAKRAFTIVGALLILLLVCGGSYYALRNVHCIIDCAPVRSFEVTDMGVPLEYFPPGAQYVLPMSSLRVDQPDVARLGSMGVVWQEYPDAALNVYRFWTEKGSRKAFLGITASHAPTLRPDSRIHFKSDIADEFNYGCGISEFGGFRCTFVARYEEFIIAFNSDMDDGIMTPDYFNQIIGYIDDQMTARLKEYK